MTPATVSGLAQSLPLFSGAKPDSSPQGDRSAKSQSAQVQTVKEATSEAVDTVSISELSRQAVTDARKETPLVEEPTKENTKKEAAQLNDNEKPGRGTANVQFVYDLKGELKVRYMDTADRLIYQVPSELMTRLKESAAKSDSPVNTKV